MAESKSIYEKLAEMRVELQAKKLIKTGKIHTANMSIMNFQISFHPAIVLQHGIRHCLNLQLMRTQQVLHLLILRI